MAIPAATGRAGKKGTASSSPKSHWLLVPGCTTKTIVIVTAHANNSHLSCWRSIPWTRRNRSTSAVREARPQPSIRM
jgi:hypothetical protein